MQHRARTWIAEAGALERAVEADIRAELAAHLELSEEALETAGFSPLEARARARERFGDLERTVRACRRAKLGGRTMMQRMNLIATLALLAAVLFFGLRAQAWMQGVAASSVALEERLRAIEVHSPAPPTPESIVIEVGDLVETLDRHRQRDWGQRERVGPDGKILLEDLGWMLVAGLTRDELTLALNEAYRAYYQDLTVDVRVTKVRHELRTIVIAPGDRIELVSGFHPMEFSGSHQVAVDGTILLPEVGHVEVAGLTRAEFEQLLHERYAPFYEELDLKARVHPAD